jgi:hypothetical protein
MNAGRYLAGLCVSALGLCGGGWLVLTPFAFGYPHRGRAAVTGFATGGGLALVALAALTCWALAWRRKLRADGVLPARRRRRSRRSDRRQARAERLVLATRTHELAAAPDPAQVLTDLRALLTPLLAAEESALIRTMQGTGGPAEPAAASSVVPEPAAAEPVAMQPVAAEPVLAVPAPAPASDVLAASRAVQVQAPGHLRGSRSASFLAPSPPPAEPLLRGAELLMVGTGEEEAW